MMITEPSQLHRSMQPEKQGFFRRGVELFNRREFFACHEALEEIWTPSRGPERQFLQALIHFAVGFYHHQRHNQAGAERQLRKGLKKLVPFLPEFDGVDTGRLRAEVSQRLEAIAAGRRVEDFPQISLFQERFL